MPAHEVVVSRYANGLGRLQYLGSGGEGFVYSDGTTIHKFLVNWCYPRRDIKRTLDNLTEFASCTSARKHLYAICVSLAAEDCIHISYKANPGSVISNEWIRMKWHNGLQEQIRETFSEFVETGFFSTDPSPGNFVLDGNTVMFCDYGSDIRPLRNAIVDIGEMHYIRKLKKLGIYLWQVDE